MDFGSLASGIAGSLNTAYNLYTNKRDFDYQKALQQTIFEREDTSVQRRMADLQAAGINPNLAAGSAAGAGSVVARSSTNDVNMGSALDMIQAVNTIRQQKQQINNAKEEYKSLYWNAINNQVNAKANLMTLLHQLGFNITPTFKDNQLSFEYNGGTPYAEDTNKFFDNLDYQASQLKNTADLLQKDLDFYNYDKISEYLMPLLKILGLGRK